MFDMDEHGQEAVKAISGILPPHKLRIASLPLKDPNECLVNGKAEDAYLQEAQQIMTRIWLLMKEQL